MLSEFGSDWAAMTHVHAHHSHADHGHAHGPGGDFHDRDASIHSHAVNRNADRRALWIAFGITATFTVAELVGGWLSGSLALLADAGHMFTDAGAMGLSLAAIWLTGRPDQARRTYGLYRAEILAALLNAITLLAICGWIFYQAYQRFNQPPEIKGGMMLTIAILGLVANAATFYVLWRSGGESLNLRGALLHVLGDLLGSVGAIGAAVVVLTTGWNQADALISVLIALLIIVSAWRLLRETLRVLLEIAPAHIGPAEIMAALSEIPGVAEVHDVHVWTITSGMDAISGHLRLNNDELTAERLEIVLNQAYRALDKFNLAHVTIQIEPFNHKAAPCSFTNCADKT